MCDIQRELDHILVETHNAHYEMARIGDQQGKSVTVDFIIVTPAAESYCKEAARKPLYAAELREVMKINKYSQSCKDMDDIHCKPFVLESGGVFGVRAQEVFRKICDLITQSTGHFWKSRLLVTLAKITFTNAQK
jgi:hypothetical protein